MSLAQLVQSNTKDGHTIIDFLIDVMHGRLNHFKPCHRLSAARMLIIYGHQDASDFISDNSPADPFTRPATRRSLRIAGVNPELARLVKSQTDGGRTIIDFIVAVMEGRIREARPHHRMAAARDLLERGFGKLPHRRLPTPPKPFRSPTHRQHSYGYTARASSPGAILRDLISRAIGDPDHTNDTRTDTPSPNLSAHAIQDSDHTNDTHDDTLSPNLPTHAIEESTHDDTPDPDTAHPPTAHDDTTPIQPDTPNPENPLITQITVQTVPPTLASPTAAPSSSPPSTPTPTTTDPQSRKSPNHTNHSSDRPNDPHVPSRCPLAIPTFDPNTYHY